MKFCDISMTNSEMNCTNYVSWSDSSEFLVVLALQGFGVKKEFVLFFFEGSPLSTSQFSPGDR